VDRVGEVGLNRPFARHCLQDTTIVFRQTSALFQYHNAVVVDGDDIDVCTRAKTKKTRTNRRRRWTANGLPLPSCGSTSLEASHEAGSGIFTRAGDGADARRARFAEGGHCWGPEGALGGGGTDTSSGVRGSLPPFRPQRSGRCQNFQESKQLIVTLQY
jgi:hypothetical protein